MRRNKLARLLRDNNAGAKTVRDDNKFRLQFGGSPVQKSVEPMVSDSADVINFPSQPARVNSLNEVSRMEASAVADATNIIIRRFQEAQPTTDKYTDWMTKWEKQYNGEWLDRENEDADHIYLTKTREQVHVIGAFIDQIVTQLPSLVTFRPLAQSLTAIDEEWRRAKVAEALVNFYLDEVWKVRTDLFPKWSKTFLKFSQGIWEVSYKQSAFGPDLHLDVTDRAMLYIDPFAHDLRHARWVIKKEWVQRAEIIENFEDGTWEAPKWLNWYVRGVGLTQPNQQFFDRFFGTNIQWSTPVREDDLVEVWHYYQAPIKGLSHRYAVMVGGIGGAMVWYGPNPFPYKGIPFRGKSYDPHEYKVDGNGLAELYRPVAEVINTLFNLRLDDIRQNIHNPIFTDGRFVNDTTVSDMEERQKLVRLDPDAIAAARATNPGFRLNDEFVPSNIRTSTGELFNDLAFIGGQGKEIISAGDTFRGQMATKETTLGEIQQTLTQNLGVFRPIIKQVMRGFEELAEIVLEYMKDPDFFGEERIVQIIGKNRYQDVIKDWYHPAGQQNVAARRVTPDEMDVDVTINAVDGGQAMLTRSMRVSSLQQIFGAMGQVQGMFQEVQDRFDWGALLSDILWSGSEDMGSIERTPEEVQKIQADRIKMQQMQQQNNLAYQGKMMGLIEGAKEGARKQREIAVDTNKAALEAQAQQEDGAQKMEQIIAQESARSSQQLLQSIVDHQHSLEMMVKELQITLAAQRSKPDSSGA